MNTSISQVQSVLSTTPARWQLLTSTLPADLLNRPPAPAEWSALHCLQHLLNAERSLFPIRLKSFLAGQNFTPFDPNQQPADLDALTPAQLADAFTHYRQQNLALISQLTDEDLERSVLHPTFGPVTLSQMLNTWAAHDLMHTVQAERALMQPFMLACGGWRTFFRDHEIAVPKE